ncbi:hypothetical protein TSUD_194620 [Trifolium subterraneum]|uniref:Uncharacterized protein n=1 Tax=Trifolium subterraneum TaxID=3900 RepID=A0A2Z6PRD5_TRISU|nr:hypothetical protein TSUD_194620 [Trifolium subterraneum]
MVCSMVISVNGQFRGFLEKRTRTKRKVYPKWRMRRGQGWGRILGLSGGVFHTPIMPLSIIHIITCL